MARSVEVLVRGANAEVCSRAVRRTRTEKGNTGVTSRPREYRFAGVKRSDCTGEVDNPKTRNNGRAVTEIKNSLVQPAPSNIRLDWSDVWVDATASRFSIASAVDSDPTNSARWFARRATSRSMPTANRPEQSVIAST